MPHRRSRYATSLLRHMMSHSPIVGVIGQRQTGKTTLAESLAKEYETLDLRKNLTRAETDPEAFLQKRKSPFAIDECQLAPDLFPALKEQVRIQPRPGRFILTGSVRFTSRKAIRESLTGRIVNLELLPLSIAESHEEALPAFLLKLLQSDRIPELDQAAASWLHLAQKKFDEFLRTGGLPGICFFRNAHIRASRFETQLETLLERDLRLLVDTRIPHRQLRELLVALAETQGLPLNLAILAKRIGATPPTIRKLLQAMEAMFLIRMISTDSQKRPVAFLEDQGMATYLAPEKMTEAGDLTRGLFVSILPQFLYRPETTPIFSQFRTRGGAKVSIAIRTNLGRIGIIPVAENEPPSSATASARSFVAEYPKAKAVIAHTGSNISRISDNVIALPFTLLLSDSWR